MREGKGRGEEDRRRRRACIAEAAQSLQEERRGAPLGLQVPRQRNPTDEQACDSSTGVACTPLPPILATDSSAAETTTSHPTPHNHGAR